MSSFIFKNCYIKDYFSIVGPLEKNSRLKKYDMAIDDYYYGEKTFELAEIKMQKTVIDNLLFKNNLDNTNINFVIGGDLINQISITSYSLKDYNIPFLGVYSACATFTESLLIAGMFISNNCRNILAITSSHNLTAEKQYRYPIEYGALKPHTATFTATASVGALITNKETTIKIESGTIGTPTDMGITDPNNMGAAMAPAAASVLNEHLTDLKRDITYYDLILTGDLGCVGADIFLDFAKIQYNLKIKKHIDAGCELYLKNQETYAGGSGPACLPLVLFNKILDFKKYKKILIIGTGALHSPILINQKNSIPAIAHAISLEVQ